MVSAMVRKAENTAAERQAGHNPVIKNELSMFSVKGNSLLHPKYINHTKH